VFVLNTVLDSSGAATAPDTTATWAVSMQTSLCSISEQWGEEWQPSLVESGIKSLLNLINRKKMEAISFAEASLVFFFLLP